MNAFTFNEAKELTFYKDEDNNVYARILFLRDVNNEGTKPICVEFGFPENYPYGKREVVDGILKQALKDWIENDVIPAINEAYGLI
jgi:hypothetical protein